MLIRGQYLSNKVVYVDEDQEIPFTPSDQSESNINAIYGFLNMS